MTSGSIALSTSNPYLAVRLDWWEQWVDAPANVSAITVELRASRTNTGYNSSGTKVGSIVINGTSHSIAGGTATVSYNSNTLIASVSTNVTHDADGSKTITISSNGRLSSGDNWWASTSGSGSATLTTLRLAPSAPSGLTVARVSDGQQNLAWTNNPGTRSPYEQVRVYRWDSAGGAGDVAVLGGVSSWSDTGTVADRQYGYHVRAVNSAGESGNSNDAYVQTTPNAPSGVSAAKAVSDIQVTWTDTSSAETGFEVWHAAGGVWDGSALASVGAGVTSYTHTSPSASATHTYKVRAVSGSQVSAYSADSNTVQLLAPPNPPTSLTPTTVFDATAAKTFGWQHNPVDSTAQTAYELRYRIGAAAWTTTGKVASSTSSRTLAAGTLTNGNTYEWQVRTWGQYATESAWSASATVRTSAVPVAGITTPASGATVTTSSVTPVWTYYDAEGSTQSGWAVTLYQAGTPVWTRSGSDAATSTAVDYRLANATTYLLGVKVRDGDGVWSSEVTRSFGVSYAPPTTPEVSVSWSESTGSATVTVTNPATGVAVVSNDITRDGVKIATIPPNGTYVDRIPPLGVPVAYVVTAWTATPSSAQETATVTTQTAFPWAWLNGGPGWQQSARCLWNPEWRLEFERGKVLRQFVADEYPTEFAGRGRSGTVQMSFTRDPDDPTTSGDAWAAVADLAAPLCLRLPKGRRYWVSAGRVSWDAAKRLAVISVPLTRVHHDE